MDRTGNIGFNIGGTSATPIQDFVSTSGGDGVIGTTAAVKRSSSYS